MNTYVMSDYSLAKENSLAEQAYLALERRKEFYKQELLSYGDWTFLTEKQIEEGGSSHVWKSGEMPVALCLHGDTLENSRLFAAATAMLKCINNIAADGNLEAKAMLEAMK